MLHTHETAIHRLQHLVVTQMPASRAAVVQAATLERTLAEVRDEHSRALVRAEKQLNEERARWQRAVQQRAEELDSQSAAQHEELRAAVQKAEALRKNVADSESSMLRQVCFCHTALEGCEHSFSLRTAKCECALRSS